MRQLDFNDIYERGMARKDMVEKGYKDPEAYKEPIVLEYGEMTLKHNNGKTYEVERFCVIPSRKTILFGLTGHFIDDNGVPQGERFSEEYNVARFHSLAIEVYDDSEEDDEELGKTENQYLR